MVYYTMKYDHLKAGVATSECYFLKFSKIMKFQRMLLTRIRNSLPKVKILQTVTCSMYQNCSEVTVLYDTVSRK